MNMNCRCMDTAGPPACPLHAPPGVAAVEQVYGIYVHCDRCDRLSTENEALKKENEWCEKRLGDILQEKIDDLTARNESYRTALQEIADRPPENFILNANAKPVTCFGCLHAHKIASDVLENPKVTR